MLVLPVKKIKMAQNLVISPNSSLNKTRNAILRIKNCSPKFRDVLRQRCKERIFENRSKLLDRFRNCQINDDVKHVLSGILVEEWKTIDSSEEDEQMKLELLKLPEINIDEELALEDILLHELMAEHEKWLVEEYESLLDEELNENKTVVCPLCKIGKFRIIQTCNDRKVVCMKCDKSFKTCKSLQDLQRDIFDNLNLHNRQCYFDPEFGAIFEHEAKENLCIMCEKCLFMRIIM